MTRFSLAPALAAVCCLAGGCSPNLNPPPPGPPGPKPDSPPPRVATVAVKVLDESTNRWFTSSELYLKVESSLEPGVAQLLPINVGCFRGQQQVVHETRFYLQPGKDETLLLEWLDDQTMTADQRAAIAAAIND